VKNTLRIIGLVTLVSFAMLSEAQAGTCRIRCSNGTTYNFATATGSDCCNQIETRCPNGGTGSYNGLPCAL
jgi:hypothetical protein